MPVLGCSDELPHGAGSHAIGRPPYGRHADPPEHMGDEGSIRVLARQRRRRAMFSRKRRYDHRIVPHTVEVSLWWQHGIRIRAGGFLVEIQFQHSEQEPNDSREGDC